MTSAIDQLKEMKEKYDFVSTKTDAMHKACEKLLEDQVQPTGVCFIRVFYDVP